ncbi:MAG TPA: nucleoside-diphosphate kinase [Candidatus Woesebacteria bacterium]|nr:nucleoside-diphosphate kinase [Candidatus Woesebacteria bacterium]
MQKTVVLVKPDGLQRGLVGEIISRFERKGLKLAAIKMVQMSDEIIDSWYAHLKDKSFFGEIKSYISWTPIVAMVWEGLDAVDAVRKIVGITKAREAEAGSIRGDLGMSQQNNLIHASDSPEAAEKEMGLIFNKDEIFIYQSGMDCLVYGKNDLEIK